MKKGRPEVTAFECLVDAPGPQSPGAKNQASCLHLVDDALKARRVVDGHVRQHLAVDVDLRLLQPGHELAVGDTQLTAGGVDARNPELAKHPLAGAAVTVGVLAGLHHRLFGDAEDVFAAAAVALGELQNFLVAGVCRYTTFDARHVCVLLVRWWC